MKPAISLLSFVLALASVAEGQNKASAQDVALENLKVGVLGKDDTATESSLESVAAFSKLGKILEADQTKRIYATATLKEKGSGKAFKAQQVFAVFTHESGKVSSFVFDSQGNGNYAIDISLAKAYKDFEGISGKYSVRFVSGDAQMKNPINFIFADIKLTLPAIPAPVVPKSQQVSYEPHVEIVHQFRKPDERPYASVSLVFTVICLAPLGLLVISWLCIGINFGNMPVSPWVLIFHSSLAAVFGLYFIFWLELDMFATLKYLAIVGAVAFISGNRVLRALADQRKAKTE